MSNENKPEISVSEAVLFPTLTLQKKILDNGTPCEVFRNNTTAVEVIIKEVSKDKKNHPEGPNLQGITIKRLESEIARLKYDLKQANAFMEKSRKGFRSILTEVKNQLDAANERDMDARSKNLTLQLENEKLKCLLESKKNLVDKLKKELNNLKRVIKLVVKGICAVPEVPENISCTTDLEYDDFENYLKGDVKVKLAAKLFDGTATFDTNISKEQKNSFDKPPC